MGFFFKHVGLFPKLLWFQDQKPNSVRSKADDTWFHLSLWNRKRTLTNLCRIKVKQRTVSHMSGLTCQVKGEMPRQSLKVCYSAKAAVQNENESHSCTCPDGCWPCCSRQPSFVYMNSWIYMSAWKKIALTWSQLSKESKYEIQEFRIHGIRV